MKAGGVKFADTPDEAASHAEEILRAGDQRPHAARRAGRLARGRQAGVLRRRHLGRHPQAAGDDLLRRWAGSTSRRSPRPTRTRSAAGTSRTSASRRTTRPRRSSPPPASPARRCSGCTPIMARLARLFSDYDMTLAEINPLAELEDGTFVAVDAHMDMENEARPRQKALLEELGVGDEETRQAREATPFELAGEAVDATGPPRRRRQRDRVRRRPRPRDRRRRRLADAVRRRPRPRRQARQLLRDRRQPVGREGLRPGQARAAEAGRGQDRGDDVDRLQHARGHRRPRRDQGVRGAGLRPGGEDRDLPHPGRLGGGGLQDPRGLRRPLRRPLRVAERGRPRRAAAA